MRDMEKEIAELNRQLEKAKWLLSEMRATDSKNLYDRDIDLFFAEIDESEKDDEEDGR